MRFISSVVAIIGAVATLVSAQLPNPITYPVDSPTLQAGQTIDIKWTPTTSGTITLQARTGPRNALAPGFTIVSGIANSGSYSWMIPSDIPQSAYYTVEIISDANPSAVNYAPQFAIDSTNTGSVSVASMTGSIMVSSMSGSIDTSIMMMTSMPTSMATMTSSSTSGSTTSGSTSTSGSSTTSMASVTAAATATAGGNGAGGLEVRGWTLGGVVALAALAWL